MPTHWEPESWEEFRTAYEAGRCVVQLSRHTRDWARRSGWKLSVFRSFDRQFAKRLLSDREAFWEAYRANVFGLHLRGPNMVIPTR